MRSLSLTQSAMRLLGEGLERFGLVRVMAFGIDGLRISGCVWSRHYALGLGEVQDDKEPDEYKQDELIDKMV
jgi:hypothetical protein